MDPAAQGFLRVPTNRIGRAVLNVGVLRQWRPRGIGSGILVGWGTDLIGGVALLEKRHGVVNG